MGTPCSYMQAVLYPLADAVAPALAAGRRVEFVMQGEMGVRRACVWGGGGGRADGARMRGPPGGGTLFSCFWRACLRPLPTPKPTPLHVCRRQCSSTLPSGSARLATCAGGWAPAAGGAGGS